MRKGTIDVGQRYVEIRDGKQWIAQPFESLKAGEIFRLWTCQEKEGEEITKRARCTLRYNGRDVGIWRCTRAPKKCGKTWELSAAPLWSEGEK